MLQWGTVFTNDCCSRPHGTITKVWQPFTTNMHTRKVSDINDVLPKLWLDFVEDHWFLALTRLNISAACCNEALYSPMIVAAGHMGPLPRSDNPSQPTPTLGRCQTSMMCGQSCSEMIFVKSWISHPYKTQYQCSMLKWGTVLTNDCCSGRVVYPLPRSDNHLQPPCTLGRCQSSMMCCQSCG